MLKGGAADAALLIVSGRRTHGLYMILRNNRRPTRKDKARGAPRMGKRAPQPRMEASKTTTRIIFIIIADALIVGCGGGERSEVVVDIKTSGGATFVADLVASGAEQKHKGPRGRDAHVVMDASKDPHLAVTVTRVGSEGEAYVQVRVDDTLVAETHANDANPRVSIVGEPGKLTVA